MVSGGLRIVTRVVIGKIRRCPADERVAGTADHVTREQRERGIGIGVARLYAGGTIGPRSSAHVVIQGDRIVAIVQLEAQPGRRKRDACDGHMRRLLEIGTVRVTDERLGGVARSVCDRGVGLGAARYLLAHAIRLAAGEQVPRHRVVNIQRTVVHVQHLAAVGVDVAGDDVARELVLIVLREGIQRVCRLVDFIVRELVRICRGIRVDDRVGIGRAAGSLGRDQDRRRRITQVFPVLHGIRHVVTRGPHGVQRDRRRAHGERTRVIAASQGLQRGYDSQRLVSGGVGDGVTGVGVAQRGDAARIGVPALGRPTRKRVAGPACIGGRRQIERLFVLVRGEHRHVVGVVTLVPIRAIRINRVVGEALRHALHVGDVHRHGLVVEHELKRIIGCDGAARNRGVRRFGGVALLHRLPMAHELEAHDFGGLQGAGCAIDGVGDHRIGCRRTRLARIRRDIGSLHGITARVDQDRVAAVAAYEIAEHLVRGSPSREVQLQVSRVGRIGQIFGMAQHLPVYAAGVRRRVVLQRSNVVVTGQALHDHLRMARIHRVALVEHQVDDRFSRACLRRGVVEHQVARTRQLPVLHVVRVGGGRPHGVQDDATLSRGRMHDVIASASGILCFARSR